MADSKTICQQLSKHVAQWWPDRDQVELEWELGPIRERLPLFRVRRISPIGPGQGYIYLSIGAFEGEALFMSSSFWHLESRIGMRKRLPWLLISTRSLSAHCIRVSW